MHTLSELLLKKHSCRKFSKNWKKERSNSKQAEASTEEREAALKAALQARDELQQVDPLSFNEAETRTYLIDQMLADEGWDVGKGEQDTDEVKKELPVKHQPTDSGDGYADYVLFDDNGRPLAVIEAKKASEDPQKRTHASKALCRWN